MSPAARKKSSRKSPATSTRKKAAGVKSPRRKAQAKRSGSKKSGAAKRGPGKLSAGKHAAKTTVARKVVATKSGARSASATRASSTLLVEYNRKRDFSRTQEPEGTVPARSTKALEFVIQKHAASHLHYDLRLELDGVMKSWAVPKGPSTDPRVRRLAMEVEDHPISYNEFEGTIPAGEYGGGTVMLWDRGTYTAEDGGGVESLRRGYEKGDLKITLAGKRLRGSWVLVRMNRPGRPQWLMIKHRDGAADAVRDITAEFTTSVVSRRSMESIAGGKGSAREWRSNR